MLALLLLICSDLLPFKDQSLSKQTISRQLTVSLRVKCLLPYYCLQYLLMIIRSILYICGCDSFLMLNNMYFCFLPHFSCLAVFGVCFYCWSSQILDLFINGIVFLSSISLISIFPIIFLFLLSVLLFLIFFQFLEYITSLISIPLCLVIKQVKLGIAL